MRRILVRNAGALLGLALAVAATGCAGTAGENGTPGTDGTSCTVKKADGVTTIECDDGTIATVADGAAGASCTVADNGDGTRTITCDDGTVATIANGEAGADGAPGVAGEAGTQGEAGAQGEAGVPGEKGDKGDPGEAGPAGDIGPAGPAGAVVYPGVNYVALHDMEAPDFDANCISCHADMPEEGTLDVNVAGFHSFKLTSGLIPGATINDQCVYCHAKVDLMQPAGNIRRHVAVGVCAACHSAGDFKFYLVP